MEPALLLETGRWPWKRLTLRKDLQFLTLLPPWAAVLTQQRLLRITRAWCPDCFTEWQTERRPIYEPLLWNVSVVSLCLRHQTDFARILPLSRLPSNATCAYLSFPPWILFESFRDGWALLRSSKYFLDARTMALADLDDGSGREIGYPRTNGLNGCTSPENISDLIIVLQARTAGGSTDALAEKLSLARRTLKCLAIRQASATNGILDAFVLLLWRVFLLMAYSRARPGTLDLGQMKSALSDIPNPTRKRRDRIPFDAIRIQQAGSCLGTGRTTAPINAHRCQTSESFAQGTT